MSSYKIGTLNLPESDVILIRTLLRLLPKNPLFSWKFTNTAPYDAILANDGEEVQANDEKSPAILRLVGFHAPDGPDRISRPIRADRLKDWLDAVGKKLSENANQHQSEKTQKNTQHIPMFAPIAEKPSAENKNFTLKSSAHLLSGEQQHSESKNLRWPPNALFNLKRWPPATLLRRDPVRIRMASLLARRAVNITDLSKLSGQSMDESQKFLILLNHVGLLDVTQTEVPLAPSDTAKAALDQKTIPRASLGRHLISGIRKRLGIKIN